MSPNVRLSIGLLLIAAMLSGCGVIDILAHLPGYLARQGGEQGV